MTYQLRKLDAQNRQQAARIKELDVHDGDIMDKMQNVTAEDALPLLAKVSAAFRSEKAKRKLLEARNVELTREAGKARILQAQLAKTKVAHTEQAAVVLKLQARAGALSKYKQTIKSQEEVIAKLEDLLEAAVKSKGELQTLRQLFQSLHLRSESESRDARGRSR